MNLSDASVAQVMVPVEDFDRGTAFYRDVLGIPFLFAAPPQMAFFMCGSVRLLVGVMPPGQKPQRGSAIYFRVPDIQAVHPLGDGLLFHELPRKVVGIRAFPAYVPRRSWPISDPFLL